MRPHGMSRLLLLPFVLPVILGVAGSAAALDAPTIPELAWEERSDWVNVKADVAPAAIGDGLADDTAGLQAALDGAQDGSTVYIPPGTYRITRTLTVTGPRIGMLLVGHGRATRVVWDGEAGGRMFWSNGAAYSRYVGIVWDGQGRAAVGFDHDSKLRFETEVRHQHEAFVNCTDCGIRIGHDQQIASAEILYENCLFENCGTGVAFHQFNDYDNSFDGCEFRDCGTGISDIHGNFYARNCHFENSRVTDFFIRSEHGSSIRRCTSVGSNRFIEEGGTIAPLTVQDCHVAHWTAQDGAVVLNGSPVILFDCSFSAPPSPHPPVKLARGDQRVVHTGNESDGTDGVFMPEDAPGLLEVPAGDLPGSLDSADRSFLKEAVVVAAKVFDAKRDFAAKGDGQTDDTEAIQKTIDAAREQGKGAIAYLPTGSYVISRPLQVTGRDYSVGGSGFRTSLVWRGPEGGTMVEVRDPWNVIIEQMAIGNHDSGQMNNAVDILQTSSGGPSSIQYDGVFVYGMYQKEPFRKGLQLVGLSPESVVHILHVQGNIRIRDSAQARILANTSYEGSVIVEGKAPERDGFVGFLTRLCTHAPYTLYVRDSQSIVMSDFYNEQGDRNFLLSGNAGDPPGRVTVFSPKIHLFTPGPTVDIDNYCGQLVWTAQFYCEPNPMPITQTGDNPVDLVVLGSFFYNTAPEFRVGPAARVSLAANLGAGEDRLAEGAPEAVSAGLDDLRRLGQLDLGLNHWQESR